VHAASCPGDDKSLWVTRVSCGERCRTQAYVAVPTKA
jgi:hypothetical protein